jgi:hypothetical protein
MSAKPPTEMYMIGGSNHGRLAKGIEPRPVTVFPKRVQPTTYYLADDKMPPPVAYQTELYEPRRYSRGFGEWQWFLVLQGMPDTYAIARITEAGLM